MITLGIDIGGTSVKAAILRDGTPVGNGRSARYDKPDRGTLVSAIAEAVARARETLGSPGPDSIGLCAPGVLSASGDFIERSINVPGLVGVPLSELLAGALGSVPSKLHIVPDVHAAAEDVVQAGRLNGRVWVLALGTGVGGIVMDDGVPLRVSGRSSGHIGQIDVTLDDAPPIPTGPDGGRGGLEGYIGLRALQARYGQGLSGFTAGSDQPPMRALARAIRIGHAVYRPQHVRLVGGVALLIAQRGHDLLGLVSSGLTSLAREGWTLGFGSDLFHAARGAARLAAL
jgi:predicted NBD/HSP70 family sugar kinase